MACLENGELSGAVICRATLSFLIAAGPLTPRCQRHMFACGEQTPPCPLHRGTMIQQSPRARLQRPSTSPQRCVRSTRHHRAGVCLHDSVPRSVCACPPTSNDSVMGYRPSSQQQGGMAWHGVAFCRRRETRTATNGSSALAGGRGVCHGRPGRTCMQCEVGSRSRGHKSMCWRR